MKTNLKHPLGSLSDVAAKVQMIVEREFSSLLQQQPRLVRLSLNEAEALAWETDIPHLVLPTLALEKVQNVAGWNARQERIWRNEHVLSFAE